MKIIWLILSLSLLVSQKDITKSYNQVIPGTNLEIKMLPIPAGQFMMGSPDDETGRKVDEGPIHKVEVSPFWMSEFEVTWDLFRLYMERNIDDAQPESVEGSEVDISADGVTGATTPYTEMSFGMGTDGYPATSMTQLSASRFCEWLSAMTGNFYRLPTEAEWEYACRAGTQSAYSFAPESELTKYACFNANSNGGYCKVGSKRPNPWGLYDMHGNVAEWTLDHYIPNYNKYEGKMALNPWEEPTKTYPKVLKGGSWKDDPAELRSAARMISTKKWKKRDPQIPKSLWWHTDAPFIGFRVVRPAKTPRLDRQKKYWGHK